MYLGVQSRGSVAFIRENLPSQNPKRNVMTRADFRMLEGDCKWVVGGFSISIRLARRGQAPPDVLHRPADRRAGAVGGAVADLAVGVDPLRRDLVAVAEPSHHVAQRAELG